MCPTSRAPGSCSAALDVIYPQFATHNAHTHRRDPGTAPARRAATNSSACTAWADCCTPRRSARSGFPAGARVRAGRRAQRPACLPRAPAAGERRQHLVRQPLHGRAGAGRRNRARSDLGSWSDWTPRHIRDCQIRPRCTPDRRNSRGIDLGNPAAPRRAVRRRSLATRGAVHRAGPIIDGATQSGGEVTLVAQSRPTGARPSAAYARRPRRRSAAPSMGRARAQPAWNAAGGEARADRARAGGRRDRDRGARSC